MVRNLWHRLLDMVLGARRPDSEDRSRGIIADADRTMNEERARLARLRPIIDRLPKRDDWQRMYDERFGR
jgi:hypothetical protein